MKSMMHTQTVVHRTVDDATLTEQPAGKYTQRSEIQKAEKGQKWKNADANDQRAFKLHKVPTPQSVTEFIH